jgi:hypothetical protein
MYPPIASLTRPKICEKLRDLCRLLALTGALNLAAVAIPLYLLTPRNSLDIALSSILGISAGGLTAVSLVLAFKARISVFQVDYQLDRMIERP